jgi:L-lactate dehydrogenase complex protein LldG
VTSRTEILSRVRNATRDVPPDEATTWAGPADYERTSDASHEVLVNLFAERVADYKATVVRCATPDIAAEIGKVGGRFATPTDLPPEWTANVDAVPDEPPLAAHALDDIGGVITGAALGIAETGTIVLDAGPAQGRRALTLVPDLHICVVHEKDIVGTVPEAIEKTAEAAAEGRPITFVSGPSATSDIELNRVEGVHGPRRLVVLIAA